MTPASARRYALRELHRELTSLLLVGAMVAPLVAALLGWPVHTPLDVPLPVHATVLAAVGLVRFGLPERIDEPAMFGWIGWLVAPPVAAGFAALVDSRANVFYTERVLVDGMAVLFTLHMAAAVLRTRARRRLSPAVWIADALTPVVGWVVLASWVLIAFEHRHPAGPLLLVAGALEALALLALVADALASLPFVPHFFRRQS